MEPLAFFPGKSACFLREKRSTAAGTEEAGRVILS